MSDLTSLNDSSTCKKRCVRFEWDFTFDSRRAAAPVSFFGGILSDFYVQNAPRRLCPGLFRRFVFHVVFGYTGIMVGMNGDAFYYFI